MNKERLLNVAKACRESKNPDKFDMACVTHACGTPGCAIGHYVARQDLQSEFLPIPPGSHLMSAVSGTGHVQLSDGLVVYYTSKLLLQHLDLDADQFEELFGGEGCGAALTAVDAADYIERFVAEHS